MEPKNQYTGMNEAENSAKRREGPNHDVPYFATCTPQQEAWLLLHVRSDPLKGFSE